MGTEPSVSIKRQLWAYVTIQVALVVAVVALGVIEQLRFGHNYHSSIMPYINDLFDLAGLLAFVCLAVHVGFQFRFRWKLRRSTTINLVGLYVFSYCILSCQGGYHASRSGNHRWNELGLAVVDQEIWHAKGVFWQPFENIYGQHTYQATYLGYFYSPLICLDRRYVHPSREIFSE
jgi:hypothetical protein